MSSGGRPIIRIKPNQSLSPCHVALSNFLKPRPLTCPPTRSFIRIHTELESIYNQIKDFPVLSSDHQLTRLIHSWNFYANKLPDGPVINPRNNRSKKGKKLAVLLNGQDTLCDLDESDVSHGITESASSSSSADSSGSISPTVISPPTLKVSVCSCTDRMSCCSMFEDNFFMTVQNLDISRWQLSDLTLPTLMLQKFYSGLSLIKKPNGKKPRLSDKARSHYFVLVWGSVLGFKCVQGKRCPRVDRANANPDPSAPRITECGAFISLNKIQNLLSSEHRKQFFTWGRLVRILNACWTLSGYKLVHCPNSACPFSSDPFIAPEGPAGFYNCMCGKTHDVHHHRVSCQTCRHDCCDLCGATPYHWDSICRGADYRSIDPALKDTRPCPKCRAPIFKIDGCDHITCAQCSNHFCWRCLQNLSSDWQRTYDHTCLPVGVVADRPDYNYRPGIDYNNPFDDSDSDSDDGW